MSRMEINEIRRRNLRALLDAYIATGGKKKDFAEKVGVEAPQLTHVTAEPPSRNIGDKIARRIEVNLELPRGWLDVSQSAGVSVSSETGRTNFILHQISGNSYTGQNNSNPFTLIKLSDNDFIGEVNLDSYSSVIAEITIDEESARTMFGGRPSSSLRIHTVNGDSMLGTVTPGELAVIDISVQGTPADGIYLFEYGGEVHLKRLQRIKGAILVICDNPAYENWHFSKEEMNDVTIIGFLVGKWDMSYTRLG